MKLKLLTPFLTDFSVVTERLIRDPDDYAKLWDDVREKLQGRQHADGRQDQQTAQLAEELKPFGLDVVRFPHRSKYRKEPYNRYQTLESDSLERPVHVLEFQLDGAVLQEDWASPAALPSSADDIQTHQSPRSDCTEAVQRTGELERITIRVFDHGISLLEADFKMEGDVLKAQADDVFTRLRQLQADGVAIGSHLAGYLTKHLLQPVFDWLRNNAHDSDHFIERELEPEAEGNVLWVTRTLIFEEGDDANRKEIVSAWLRDSGGEEREGEEKKGEEKESDGKTMADKIVADSKQHLTRWLNYLFREKSYTGETSPAEEGDEGLARAFCDEWEAMLHAQYFYAALDTADLQLTRILAKAFSKQQDLNVSHLKTRLEQVMRKANLLLLQLHDNSKYYKRTVKSKLDEILEYWDFKKLVQEPVQQKIGTCEQRLKLLHEQAANRSAIFTDMILLGIGVTAVFSTFLALADYGRKMATDINLAGYDVTSSNFVERFAAQPTDVILIVSGIVSLLLVVLYWIYRKRQTL